MLVFGRAGLGAVFDYPKQRKRIEDVRVPAVKGLPDDVYHLLHRSFVGIVRMRRSIEAGDVALRSSAKAIAESQALLKRTFEVARKSAADNG
jgi:hypothetical protein